MVQVGRVLRRRWTKLAPIKPAPPVIKTRMVFPFEGQVFFWLSVSSVVINRVRSVGVWVVRHTGGMTKVLLLEDIHDHARDTFEKCGFNVTSLSGALSVDELLVHVRDAVILGVRSNTAVPAVVFEQAPLLQAVGAFCIGINHIDVVAAAGVGVGCFNAPFSNTRSVVELALGNIVALNRRLASLSEQMHAGVWSKSAAGAHEVRGQTLGIVGYGNIGSQLSVLAEALGMNVVAFDVADKLTLGNARQCGSLAELLAVADVVSLHVDGRGENKGFFGAAQFAAMRPGSLFLNLSRGSVVDYVALAQAVRSGHVRGAAVDVFPQEPSVNGADFESVLRGLPNVIMTPHIGGSTQEAQADIGRFVAGKLCDFVRCGATSLSVNLPQVVPGPWAGDRLLYLHRNAPGALAEANGVLGERGVNIVGQTLATSGELGYVVSDVGAGQAGQVVAPLEELRDAVQVRLLTR